MNGNIRKVKNEKKKRKEKSMSYDTKLKNSPERKKQVCGGALFDITREKKVVMNRGTGEGMVGGKPFEALEAHRRRDRGR